MSACADWPVICPRASDGLRITNGLRIAKTTKQATPATTTPITARRSSARSCWTRSAAASRTVSSIAPAVYFVAVAAPIAPPASSQSSIRPAR